LSLEYYGWIALASSHHNWTDSDFADGFARVERLIAQFPANNRHDLFLTDADSLLPRTLWLKGFDINDIAPVFQLASDAANIFDAAYGQIQVFNDQGDPSRKWDHNDIKTYALINQQLIEKL